MTMVFSSESTSKTSPKVWIIFGVNLDPNFTLGQRGHFRHAFLIRPKLPMRHDLLTRASQPIAPRRS